MDSSFDRWTPELRRAVMVAKPEFFAWHAPDRLRYRVRLPTEDRQSIVAELLREHGHRRPAAMAKLESHGRVSLRLQNRINEWLLPLIGVGEDTFMLNEHFADDRSILDFATLRAYDEDDHAFQQQAREEDDDAYTPEPYTGGLQATWARVLQGDRICYLTLSMASWYLHDAMQEAARVEVERLVPHRHVRGPEDGKHEEGMVRWDWRVDASGKEALLDELQRRVWAEQSRRRLQLGAEFEGRHTAASYIVDDPEPGADPGEQSLRIVFTDPDALAGVRFMSFLRDCRRLERPLPELRALEAQEAARMRAFVAEQHDDLLKNFDPKVVPLRRKRKILMHPEAIRDIEGGDLSP